MYDQARISLSISSKGARPVRSRNCSWKVYLHCISCAPALYSWGGPRGFGCARFPGIVSTLWRHFGSRSAARLSRPLHPACMYVCKSYLIKCGMACNRKKTKSSQCAIYYQLLDPHTEPWPRATAWQHAEANILPCRSSTFDTRVAYQINCFISATIPPSETDWRRT